MGRLGIDIVIGAVRCQKAFDEGEWKKLEEARERAERDNETSRRTSAGKTKPHQPEREGGEDDKE